MKKTLFTIFAFAAILVSCTKESETAKVEDGSNVFTATFSDDFGVKTTLDSGTKQVSWEQNDKITINRISFSAQTAGTSSTFNQQLGTAEVTAPYHAFYPAIIAGSGASGTLPADQTYTPGKATNLPMYAYSQSEKSLTFKNICGVLKIKVPSGYQVNTITVSTTDDKALHGAFTVVNDVAVMNVSSVPDANKTLTVNQEVNTNDEILVAIPAATYSNLTITVYGASNDVVVCTGTINNFTITANHIKKITLKDYFYIEAVEAGEISFYGERNAPQKAIKLEYSTDKLQWHGLYSRDGSVMDLSPITTVVGTKYYFRAPEGHTNPSFGNDITSDVNSVVYKFDIKGNAKVGGNILYLLSNTGNATIGNRAFSHLLSGTSVSDASALRLPSDQIAEYCYEAMFENSSLVTPPELPSTSVAKGCYGVMFQKCSNLQTAPILPATTLAVQCYDCMFNSCTSLTSVTMLAENVEAEKCLNGFLDGAGDQSASTKGTLYVKSNMVSAVRDTIKAHTQSHDCWGWTVSAIQ